MKRTVQGGSRTTKASSERSRVTPQSLMRGDYVTLSKARELLGGADWRTLNGWIEELGFKTYAHPTDGRSVLLRSTDVAKIAKISDRSLPEPQKKRTRVSSRAELARQLEELLVLHERTVAEHERELAVLREQHRRELEALRQRISELEQQ